MKINLRARSASCCAGRTWPIVVAGSFALTMGLLVALVGVLAEAGSELRLWLFAMGLFVALGLYGVLKLPGSNLALRGACLLIFVACVSFMLVEWQAYFHGRSGRGPAVSLPAKSMLAFLIVGVPCLVYSCLGYIRGLDEDEDEDRDRLTALAKELEAQLLNPKFEELESLFGAELPAALKQLYRSEVVIQFSSGWFRNPEGKNFALSGFLPLNAAAVMDNPQTSLLGLHTTAEAIARKEEIVVQPAVTGLPFATDGCGDAYVICFNTTRRSWGSVLLTNHEGGTVDCLAPSLEDFLSWIPETAKTLTQ